MTDKEFKRIIELKWVGGGFIPVNANAQDLAEQLRTNEQVAFLEVTARDLSFHRNYFAFLNFIYGYMPPKFQKAIPKEKFYIWLKHLKGQYEVIYTFKDGTTLVEYDSIAFGNMSEKHFHEYIKEQLPWIYENVIGAYFKDEIYNSIVETIEQEFEKFFTKL
jgi:hypothetical protein